MQAAVTALASASPARVVIAVPVAPQSTAVRFRRLVDEFVCLETPEPFYAVGTFYNHFGETSDGEVRELLAEMSSRSEVAR